MAGVKANEKRVFLNRSQGDDSLAEAGTAESEHGQTIRRDFLDLWGKSFYMSFAREIQTSLSLVSSPVDLPCSG
jgi:hypothetical protein